MAYLYKTRKENGKTVLVHRRTMEHALGRKLARAEIVHHRNHVKHDNRDLNLEVTTAREHRRHHAGFAPKPTTCGVCGVEFCALRPRTGRRQQTCSARCHRLLRAAITSAQHARYELGEQIPPETVTAMREIWHAGGISRRKVIQRFGINGKTGHLLIEGQAYKHVPFDGYDRAACRRFAVGERVRMSAAFAATHPQMRARSKGLATVVDFSIYADQFHLRLDGNTCVRRYRYADWERA